MESWKKPKYSDEEWHRLCAQVAEANGKLAQEYDKYMQELHPEILKEEKRAKMALHVRELALWSAAKPAFELRLSSLPPKIAKLRWFEALCALETADGATPAQRMYKTRALQLIALAFDLPVIGGVYPILAVNGEVLILQSQGRFERSMIHFSAAEMDDLRAFLCEANGYRLPDEAEDPVLAAAAERMKDKAGIVPAFSCNMDDICASMALQAGCEPEEVLDWTVTKFNAMARAVTRMEDFRIYRLLGSIGILERTRNPVPFWLLEKVMDMPACVASIRELDKGAKGLL